MGRDAVQETEEHPEEFMASSHSMGSSTGRPTQGQAGKALLLGVWVQFLITCVWSMSREENDHSLVTPRVFPRETR
jgi:hypothetical protein